jgi:hypothetical protein
MASTADNLLDVVSGLGRQPLRNIVLLKHIEAFREHVSAVQVPTDPIRRRWFSWIRAQAPTIARPIRRRPSPH